MLSDRVAGRILLSLNPRSPGTPYELFATYTRGSIGSGSSQLRVCQSQRANRVSSRPSSWTCSTHLKSVFTVCHVSAIQATSTTTASSRHLSHIPCRSPREISPNPYAICCPSLCVPITGYDCYRRQITDTRPILSIY